MTASTHQEDHQHETPSQGVLDTLIAARKLIERKEHWTREVYARDAKGDAVAASSPKATCWCAYGAIARATQDLSLQGDAEFALRDRVPMGLLAAFNDSHTHAEVLALFDRAIEAERAKVSP